MELESIGRNIRKFRLMRNLRQEDLAEMAGLSINYVGALERGEKIPSLETFIVLLNALEVSSDMVLSSLLVEKHQADSNIPRLSGKSRRICFIISFCRFVACHPSRPGSIRSTPLRVAIYCT